MLKKHLTAIKGELFNHIAIQHIDMNTKGDGSIDFDELGASVELCMKDLFSIRTVDDLDRFCEEWGLNEQGGDVTFANLATKYIALG